MPPLAALASPQEGTREIRRHDDLRRRELDGRDGRLVMGILRSVREVEPVRTTAARAATSDRDLFMVVSSRWAEG